MIDLVMFIPRKSSIRSTLFTTKPYRLICHVLLDSFKECSLQVPMYTFGKAHEYSIQDYKQCYQLNFTFVLIFLTV